MYGVNASIVLFDRVEIDCLRTISSVGAARTLRPAKRTTAANRKDIFQQSKREAVNAMEKNTHIVASLLYHRETPDVWITSCLEHR